MGRSLQDEIRQNKPFASKETEAIVALALTADRLGNAASQVLKPFDLTPTQYNMLRILRGAEPDGLNCGGIAERMLTRDPDITRLLDRLEKRGLLRRERDGVDRRVIHSRITSEGLGILDHLDQPIEESNRRLMAHLGPQRLQVLIDLLGELREFAG
jgi:MarR family transcriptional regulator, organic hydroperoxide resistance regulator